MKMRLSPCVLATTTLTVSALLWMCHFSSWYMVSHVSSPFSPSPPEFHLEKAVSFIVDEATANDTRQKRLHVVKMMLHAWKNYKLYAWGDNELQPISKRPHVDGIFGDAKLGLTIVDGLDTLFLMGLEDEFKEGRDWIAEHLHFSDVNQEVSVFETNIRLIGGLLSCYALTGDVMFRGKAVDIADALLPAFNTPTGLPHGVINPASKINRPHPWAGSNSILAEVGTLHIEFTYLSDITENNVYRNKVNRIRSVLYKMKQPGGLYPVYIDTRSETWGTHRISLGAMGDSFYEYLLKAWLVSGKEDKQARMMFDFAMRAALKKMLKISYIGLTYLAEIGSTTGMDHFTCFAGGMFALASVSLAAPFSERYMDVAKKLTETCHESYARSETKLGPEYMSLSRRLWFSTRPRYSLQPETVESYFILWRLTKEQKYRDWGWEVVQALEKHCRVEGGYAGINNVYNKNSSHDDVQKSFFLAETLKYLFLLFADDSLISLDDWVFNTEAHPLPVKYKNPNYESPGTALVNTTLD